MEEEKDKDKEKEEKVEVDPMKNIKFPEGKKFGEWKIGKVLDEGGFGMVYLATSMNDPKKIAALKAESNEIDGGSAIKLECMILNKLNERGPAPHIPAVYLSAKRKLYCYMVMTLLGPNLKKLKQDNKVVSKGFTRGTWSRIGIQCLYGLKFVHDNGFVHRDIKPQNFLLGNEKDKERCRMVHILDFGLARPFAVYNKRDKMWLPRRARGTAEFRGTLRYTSPNVHLKREQGRADDVCSLIYVLIELNGGPALPWQNDSCRERVEQKKLMMPSKVVMTNMPACMGKVLPHLETLDCYQRPDYHMIFKSLYQVMENEKITPASKYDWETETPEKSATPADWENPAGPYFSADPINICEPPPRGVPDFSMLDNSGAVKKQMRNEAKEKEKEKKK